jgi:hypothetical protein
MLYPFCIRHTTACTILWSLVALVVTLGVIYSFFSQNFDVLIPEKYPTWSFGYEAKGVFAIGVYARGIFCLGVFVDGMFSIGVAGVGLMFFGGFWGATIGLGFYHIGIAWYCIMGQLSVNIYNGYMIHIGINLLAPTCEKRQVIRFIVNHCECLCWGD